MNESVTVVVRDWYIKAASVEAVHFMVIQSIGSVRAPPLNVDLVEN